MLPNSLRLARCRFSVRSIFVTSFAFLCLTIFFAVSTTPAMQPKNPLKLVVSRFPRYEVLYRNPKQESLVGWLDTLECGHQVELFNFGLSQPSFGPSDQGQKRHRCAECAQVKVLAAAAGATVGDGSPKKPAQSVTLDEFRQRERTA